MRVVAVMTARNDRAYLGNALRHLIDNGLDFYIIDNESTDETHALLRTAPFAHHLAGLEIFPFDGEFDWRGLMRAREQAARKVDADWIVFVSPDEMMHSYVEGESLADAIVRIGRDGSDVIDFNEFVFLPVEADYVPDCGGYPPPAHYYFFEPSKPRLMRARRSGLQVSTIATGGHTFVGSYQLAAETMALRHYIFRDQRHAYRKYTERVFKADELALGWHANRSRQARECFALPPTGCLYQADPLHSRSLDRSSPRGTHYWQWPSMPGHDARPR